MRHNQRIDPIKHGSCYLLSIFYPFQLFTMPTTHISKKLPVCRTVSGIGIAREKMFK